MSRLKEMERKKSLLSAEKRVLLDQRLRGNLSAFRSEAKVLRSIVDARSVLAACNLQGPLQVSWEALWEAGLRQTGRVPEGLDVKQSLSVAREANRSALACVSIALTTLGIFTEAGEKQDPEELTARFQILPSYKKLVRRWLTELADAGLLNKQDGLFVSAQPLLSRISIDAVGDAQLRQMASEEIPAIITGKKHTLDFVFANGSAEAVENAYEGTAQSRYFNSIVEEVVRVFVEAFPQDRQFRVFEAGAGVGGTTTSLLPILPAANALYVFTDLSNYFLDHAKLKYSSFPFVCYDLWDINTDPLEMGYRSDLFDLVIGANVIHCSRYLEKTLRYLRAMMAPGGILILLEYTENRPAHIILPGLLEGFNHFEDERTKENKPLLSPSQWFGVLRSSGFKECLAFPEEASPMNALGQHVIVARAN